MKGRHQKEGRRKQGTCTGANLNLASDGKEKEIILPRIGHAETQVGGRVTEKPRHVDIQGKKVSVSL